MFLWTTSAVWQLTSDPPTLHNTQSPTRLVEPVVEKSLSGHPREEAPRRKDHSLKFICQCLQRYRLVFEKYLILSTDMRGFDCFDLDDCSVLFFSSFFCL